MRGAEYRYGVRQARWRAAVSRGAWVRHHYWWLLHNAVSHPLLGVWPSPRTVWFHDWTAWGLNRYDTLRPSVTPEIPSYRLWFTHNVLGHLAIGLFPYTWAFDFHDRGSKAMKVKGWV